SALGIRQAEPGQKLTCEKPSLVVLADDGEAAALARRKAAVVAARANVLATNDERGRFRSTVALVAIERQVIAHFDIGEAQIGKRIQEELAIAEDNLSVGEVLTHDSGGPRVRANARRPQRSDRVPRRLPGDPAPTGVAHQ